MNVLIIGGGTAGTTAALELRKLDKDVNITILEQSSYTQYSYCALPYLLEGQIKNFNDLMYYNEDFFKQQNIKIKLNHDVTNIDLERKEVDGICYDKLIIATGSKAITLGEGYTFKSIDDVNKLKEIKEDDLTIVGGGFVGVEVAWALNKIGKKVTIIENKDHLMSNSFDSDMSELIEKYLEENGIDVLLNSRYTTKKNTVFACGVKANTKIAEIAGIKLENGIVVNEYMQTSNDNVYACGDCINSAKLALPAIKQAKVVAHNVLGKKEMYLGSQGNIISKIGELIFGSVGKCEGTFSKFKGKTKAHYMTDAKDIQVKLYAKDDIITGCQIVGYEEVLGRLNLIALAVEKRLKIKDLIDMHTCYNPSVSPVFEPLVVAAEILQKKND